MDGNKNLGCGDSDGDEGGRSLGGNVVSGKKYWFALVAVTHTNKKQPRSAASGNKYLILAIIGRKWILKAVINIASSVRMEHLSCLITPWTLSDLPH